MGFRVMIILIFGEAAGIGARASNKRKRKAPIVSEKEKAYEI